MCGLDDKMREEKRNKRDAVKRENRMGCCCNDTHSHIWIYRQLYFIDCIYKRYKVKWNVRDGVGWNDPICIYRLYLITLLYCLYIYRYKVKWCKGDGLVMWQIFSFFRQSLSSSSCAPQWFFLPVAWWEAQCAEVNLGIFCEECLHLVQHVISRRYEIEEVFDDAEIKIGAHGVGR